MAVWSHLYSRWKHERRNTARGRPGCEQRWHQEAGERLSPRLQTRSPASRVALDFISGNELKRIMKYSWPRIQKEPGPLEGLREGRPEWKNPPSQVWLRSLTSAKASMDMAAPSDSAAVLDRPSWLVPVCNSRVALVPLCVLCPACPLFNCTSLSPDPPTCHPRVQEASPRPSNHAVIWKD